MSKKLDSRITEFLKYREFNRNFILLLGWSNKYSNVAYRILPYIHLFFGLSMTFVVFGFVKIHYSNIPLLTKGLSIMTSYIIISLKMICLIIYRKEFSELHELLDVYFMDMLKKDYPLHLKLSKIAKYRFLSWGIGLSVLICVIMYILIPLITNISNYIHQIQPDHYIFVYPSSFPWPVPFTGFIYQLHFIFESVASISLFLLTVGVDSIFIFLIFLMVEQLRDISYSIKHIDKKSDGNIIIKKCIVQYCTLMKCRDNLQKIYGPIILLMMTTNAVVLCALIYQITQLKSLTIVRAIFIVAYISTKIFQTYMYSWCGTHLAMESEEYRNAIYATNWYGNKRFMIAILIMLQQKPLILTVCHFSTVSIDIFLKILNTTMSYFFLLKTLDE